MNCGIFLYSRLGSWFIDIEESDLIRTKPETHIVKILGTHAAHSACFLKDND